VPASLPASFKELLAQYTHLQQPLDSALHSTTPLQQHLGQQQHKRQPGEQVPHTISCMLAS
jgi:hypothetical protein